MKAAEHKGKHCGRPKKVFDRAAIAELRAAALSVREIGARLGVSHMTVHKSAT
jgi:IS30 family transposase